MTTYVKGNSKERNMFIELNKLGCPAGPETVNSIIRKFGDHRCYQKFEKMTGKQRAKVINKFYNLLNVSTYWI